MMHTVITEQEARKITGGRKPLMPVEYEEALTALGACMTLDETKYWADKADALAAWAKIYRNDEAGIEARRLKLHAYRRMGQLAHELRPYKPPGGVKGRKKGNQSAGSPAGPISLMREHGLPVHTANSASALAKMSEKNFTSLVNRPKPPAPSSVLPRFHKPVSQAYRHLSGVDSGGALFPFSHFCEGNSAKDLARQLSADEVRKILPRLRVAIDWLDEFEQHLPK